MPIRKANAIWTGTMKEGTGRLNLGSGALKANYSFASRFENGEGTNPEELIGAAHAGCFSMALAHLLTEEGFKPNSVETNAEVTIDKQGDGFAIKKVVLKTEGDVPEIDDEKFMELAEGAKAGCPVSKALEAVDIELDAKLLSTA
ncbi:MAG: OsmC family peroxiredoxin [candidate division Zixibacteria bacterium]|nr:OsmC family peroxiredoxin [candidate division Zixibacteria bacterium]